MSTEDDHTGTPGVEAIDLDREVNAPAAGDVEGPAAGATDEVPGAEELPETGETVAVGDAAPDEPAGDDEPEAETVEAPHAETPEIETPETETPETETPETERPETETPETEPAEAAEPEAPEIAEPEGEQADSDRGEDADAERPDADEGVEPLNDLPDVTSDEALEASLEALLLVIDSPASEETLAETVDQPVARVTVALRTMAQRLTERASGIDLRRVGEGWRFYTRDTYAPFVEKLLLDGQRSKLTRAALESLAVIAYRQPVTRARVAAVRGVNVDGVIRTLLARGLIEEMGTDPETTGTLYVTTELFLERLGLSSLNDLPPIAPLLPEVDTIDDI
ncbi:SMC-Scp complex subunit ScpB [Amycolatopsis sp. NPDC004368]